MKKKTWRFKILIIHMVIILVFISLMHPFFTVKANEILTEDYIYTSIFISILCICFLLLILATVTFIRLRVVSERKISEASLELNHITNSIHAGVVKFIVENNYEIIYASKGYYDIIGYSKEEVKQEFNSSFLSFIHKDDLDKLDFIKEGCDCDDCIQIEVRMITKSGEIIWILINGNLIDDKNKDHTISAVLVDITGSKNMQDRLVLEEERYRVAAEISNDILFEYEIDSDTMKFADKFKELYGEEPMIPNFSDPNLQNGLRIHPEDVGVFSEYCRALRSGKEMIESEFRIYDVKDSYVWCHTRGKTIYDEKRPIRVIGKVVNIDLHKKELQTLEYKAKRDPLTGIYNKSTTKELIDNYLLKHYIGKHILMFIDIDNFKTINDRYGHLVGDKVLTYIINHVKMIFSAGEIIGRIGGDEFVVFIGDIGNKDSINLKADLLQRALKTTYREDNYNITISASIGISMYPQDGQNYHQLLECADKALYDVKEQGKDGYKLFT